MNNKMKAMVVKGANQLSMREKAIPKTNPYEVIIKLKVVALNRRDLMVIRGQYPGTTFPIIPGSDGVGIVTEIGKNVDNIAIGDEVIINPGMNWGDNSNIKNSEFSILGMPMDGTYAEYVKVSAKNVHPKPKFLSWEAAAALPLAGLTAYRAIMTKGKVKMGETVLIPGAGSGVATYMIQYANTVGANVYVTSSKKDKIEKAMNLGAKAGVNYNDKDWEERLFKLTGGIDLTVDSIAGDMFKSLIQLGKTGSRIVSFGATRGPISNLMLPMMTVKEMSIIGSTMGSPQDFTDMLEFVESHHIRPVIHQVYPFEEIETAIDQLSVGNNFGKLVVKFEDLKV